MNKAHKSLNVVECKTQAAILLKSLRSTDIEKSRLAAKRFQRLPDFGKYSPDEIIQKDIKHKNALAVIASEKGFKSWIELKCQLPFIQGGFLNQWFTNYSEAKSYHKLHGGFLLPYKNQFFTCDADYINNLGLDPKDEDWELTGYDLAKPNDQNAWSRLHKKIEKKS